MVPKLSITPLATGISMILLILFWSGCDRTDATLPTAEQPAKVAAGPSISHQASEIEGPVPETDLPAPNQSESEATMRILAWNIESEGADIEVIARQLDELERYDLYGFTEVNPPDWSRVKDVLGDGYVFWYSHTGWRDRTAYAISKSRFDIVKKYEIKEFGGKKLNPGRYRSPHIYELTDKVTGTDFVIVLNHLARGNEKVRQEQAEGLRLWAESIDQPLIAIGDYNFDYVFKTGQGNRAFDLFLADGVWTWVKPDPLVDSNWFDGDGDGKDDYPGSILDFAFVAGPAKDWSPRSAVIVREGDFPDDESTSDHRPLTLTLTPPISADG